MHTKGPWKREGNVITDPTIPDDIDTSNYLAVVYGDSHSNRMANAKLIAAAPELLEMLKEAVEHLHSSNYSNEEDDFISLINETINKAEVNHDKTILQG